MDAPRGGGAARKLLFLLRLDVGERDSSPLAWALPPPGVFLVSGDANTSEVQEKLRYAVEIAALRSDGRCLVWLGVFLALQQPGGGSSAGFTGAAQRPGGPNGDIRLISLSQVSANESLRRRGGRGLSCSAQK